MWTTNVIYSFKPSGFPLKPGEFGRRRGRGGPQCLGEKRERRKGEVGMENKEGRERVGTGRWGVCMHADILPAGSAIDEPRTPLGGRDGTTREWSLSLSLSPCPPSTPPLPGGASPYTSPCSPSLPPLPPFSLSLSKKHHTPASKLGRQGHRSHLPPSLPPSSLTLCSAEPCLHFSASLPGHVRARAHIHTRG